MTLGCSNCLAVVAAVTGVGDPEDETSLLDPLEEGVEERRLE